MARAAVLSPSAQIAAWPGGTSRIGNSPTVALDGQKRTEIGFVWQYGSDSTMFVAMNDVGIHSKTC